MVDATGLGRCFNMKPRPRLFVTGLTGCIAVWGAVLLFAQPPFTGLYESNARRPGASHCTSATRSKSQRYSHGKLIASFPIEAVQYRRLSRFWGGDPGPPEAHRATAQLLPKSHVYIYESWKDMKAGRPSLLLPRSRNPPPFRWREHWRGPPPPFSQSATPLGEIAGRIVLFVPASRVL